MFRERSSVLNTEEPTSLGNAPDSRGKGFWLGSAQADKLRESLQSRTRHVMRTTLVTTVFATLLAPQPAVAQVDFYYPKGMAGELPHERGELIDGFTGISFPISTDHETTKRFFLQGLAYLYSDDRTEALRSFREVITRDPDCAMGYWGIAMASRKDVSRQVEYMWYAFERKNKAKTDLERDLINAYSEHFGTTKKPEMVIVDSETGKRRARPVFSGQDKIDLQRNKLADRLAELVRQHPKATELLPLLALERPRHSLVESFMSNPPLSPIASRIIQWHDDSKLKWMHAMRNPSLAGVWNGVGLSFARHNGCPDAQVAVEAAWRLDNAWLKKWDAMPYERRDYFTYKHNITATVKAQNPFFGAMLKAGVEAPKHPELLYRRNAPQEIRDVRDKPTSSPSASQRRIVQKLGPLWWTPPKAPAFALPKGKTDGIMSLTDLQGPTIVVFYLGFGCIHCVEQLNELRPRYDDFKDAGIEIVAIGTDKVDDVKAAILDTIEVDGPATPFEILCDPKGDVFKAFHCWDQFTDEPLHGTFLIDGKGRIRWRDISEEPFMETDFLLKESERLIAIEDD